MRRSHKSLCAPTNHFVHPPITLCTTNHFVHPAPTVMLLLHHGYCVFGCCHCVFGLWLWPLCPWLPWLLCYVAMACLWLLPLCLLGCWSLLCCHGFGCYIAVLVVAMAIVSLVTMPWPLVTPWLGLWLLPCCYSHIATIHTRFISCCCYLDLNGEWCQHRSETYSDFFFPPIYQLVTHPGTRLAQCCLICWMPEESLTLIRIFFFFPPTIIQAGHPSMYWAGPVLLNMLDDASTGGLLYKSEVSLTLIQIFFSFPLPSFRLVTHPCTGLAQCCLTCWMVPAHNSTALGDQVRGISYTYSDFFFPSPAMIQAGHPSRYWAGPVLLNLRAHNSTALGDQLYKSEDVGTIIQIFLAGHPSMYWVGSLLLNLLNGVNTQLYSTGGATMYIHANLMHNVCTSSVSMEISTQTGLSC